MNADKFLDEQYRISFTAGMNQRYHQDRAHWFEWWHRGTAIAVGFLAVTGAILAFVPAWTVVPRIVACISAGAAIFLNVIPFGEWARQHSDLFRRWTDLREEIDALYFDLDGEPTPELIARLRAIDGKHHRICSAEPAFNDERLVKYYQAEKKSRPDDVDGAAPAAPAA
ncbi:MAG: hypothetical protein KDA60_17910 [Planctomycetales bacterium]|nr:hypothetical protein [Planctomycetales bacterium]